MTPRALDRRPLTVVKAPHERRSHVRGILRLSLARRLLTRLLVPATRTAWILAAKLVACDSDPPAEDRPVTVQTLSVIDTDIAEVRVFDRMFRVVDITGLAAEQVADAALAQIQDHLQKVLAPSCLERTLAAGELQLRFTGCNYPLGHALDGAVRIRVAPEPGDCNGVPCVAALLYTLEIDDLRADHSEILAATSTMRVPTDDAPRSQRGEAELVGPDDAVMTVRRESSWTTGLGCFTADFGLDISVGTLEISAAGRDVHVCEPRCPDAGEGLIAWGTGSALAWRYTGKGQLVVRGPRGRVFNVTQDCADG